MFYRLRIDQIERDNVYLLQKVNPDVHTAFYRWKLSLYSNGGRGESKEVIEANEKNIDNLLAINHLKKYIIFKEVGYYYINSKIARGTKERIVILEELFSGETIEMSDIGLGIYEVDEDKVRQYFYETTREEKDSLVRTFTEFKLNIVPPKTICLQ